MSGDLEVEASALRAGAVGVLHKAAGIVGITEAGKVAADRKTPRSLSTVEF